MNPDDDAALRKIRLPEEATQTGGVLFSDADGMAEFNRGCDHVYTLLRDSRALYLQGSHATSLFLAVTAIEEIAKLDIGIFRSRERTKPAQRRRDDHLFSHKSKHAIALQEVLVIGTRLPTAIGEERVRELLDMAETGELVRLREAALYIQVVDARFVCPSDEISKATARDLLLLALEVWDDRLVGVTNYTYKLDEPLMAFFDEVAAS